MYETRYLLKIGPRTLEALKKTFDPDKNDYHDNYYFNDFRLRKTHYFEDNYKTRYLIMPSYTGSSPAVKQKKEISQAEFEKLLSQNKDNLIFHQKAFFYYPRGLHIMIEYDEIEPRNGKPFSFWTTESESLQDKHEIEAFLKQYNIEYFETHDNIRTIVEKMINGNSMRDFIVQKAKSLVSVHK